MKQRLTEEQKNWILVLSGSGILIIAAYLGISKLSLVRQGLFFVFQTVMPFIFGYAIAFLVAPAMFRIERFLRSHSSWSSTALRIVATAGSIIILLLIVVLFFALIIPQLIASAMNLSNSIEGYYQQFQQLVTQLENSNWELVNTLMLTLETSVHEIVNYVSEWIPNIITNTISASIQVVKVMMNLLIGIVVAIYLLLDYERFHKQCKRILYALFNKKHAMELERVSAITSKMFNQFVVGKAVDSLIIGILCLIGCLIFRFPYAALIAFVVGITNMIPFFGPFIGAIPCIVLLVMVNPIYALWFAVFILALQQLDGNVIGPYILGDSLGLPSIWIMFAVIVGGGLFGIVGMFVGVPVFAVIYTLFREFITNRLKEKDISI